MATVYRIGNCNKHRNLQNKSKDNQ